MGSRRVIDIRPPLPAFLKGGIALGDAPARAVSAPWPKPRRVRRARAKTRKPRVLALALTAAVLTVLGFFAVGVARVREGIVALTPTLYADFKAAASSLSELETAEAHRSLLGIRGSLATIERTVDTYGLFSFFDLWSRIVPKVQVVPQTFRNIIELSEAAVTVAATLDELKRNAFTWLMSQAGTELTERLANLRASVERIIALNANLNEQAVAFGYVPEASFLGLANDLYRVDRFLAALISFLSQERERHLLVLFQNPSEMRPSGGFIGSYAELVLNRNGLADIVVWDVYDPDGQLEVEIIPPRELQGLTTTWGARDANWFFDFPTSARKVSELLEQSKIYRERGTTFDAVIAVNAHVLESVLELTGPLELAEYGLTVTSENFFAEIQREVEAGDDNRNGEPKRILKTLTPLLIERVASLSDDQRDAVLSALKRHLARRDIMLSFTDAELQSFMEHLGYGGEVVPLPLNFAGDYLSVVTANVGGGKSDAFVSQSVRLSSKVRADGLIDNFLIIERTHTGETQKDPWYRAVNTSYVKVFTPPGSRATFAAGHTERTVEPAVPYTDSYLTDRDLASLEGSARYIPELSLDMLDESGKTVFGAWVDVRPGKTSVFELSYFSPGRVAVRSAPTPYRFIFERQAGSRTTFDLLVEAPDGYHWKESGEKTFNFVTEYPLARETVSLTLVRNQQAPGQSP